MILMTSIARFWAEWVRRGPQGVVAEVEQEVDFRVFPRSKLFFQVLNLYSAGSATGLLVCLFEFSLHGLGRR